jgi:hypothetical protein
MGSTVHLPGGTSQTRRPSADILDVKSMTFDRGILAAGETCGVGLDSYSNWGLKRALSRNRFDRRKKGTAINCRLTIDDLRLTIGEPFQGGQIVNHNWKGGAYPV